MVKIFLLCVLFFCTYSAKTQTEMGKEYAEDFEGLVTSLRELHPQLYKNISPSEFDKQVSLINDRLKTTTFRQEAIYIIQELMYSIGDGHTGNISIYNDNGIQKALPFNVYLIKQKLYIKNYPSDTTYNGSQIFMIDGRSASSIIDSMKVFFPSDGKRPIDNYSMQCLFNDLYGAFFSQKDHFIVQTDRGTIHAVASKRGEPRFEQLVLKPFTAYLGNNRERLYSEKINETFAYIKFIAFTPRYKGVKIEKNYNRLIKTARKEKIPNLILDLRYNPGGKPDMAGRMTRYLRPSPFHLFERELMTNVKIPTYLPWMAQRFYYRFNFVGTKLLENGLRERIRFDRHLSKTYRPQKKMYTGHIYVITGSMTHSTATMMCHYLQDLPNVEFVGSETTGAINFLNALNHCKITLPHLKTTFSFGMELLELEEGTGFSEKSKGLIPHQLIDYTIEDLQQGRDKEMEFILKQISGKSDQK